MWRKPGSAPKRQLVTARLERFVIFGSYITAEPEPHVVSIDVFEATVLWDNHVRQVTVLAAEGGVLVGMSMLFGYRLLLEGADGGAVQIEALRILLRNAAT